MIIDTHTHLDMQYRDPYEVMERAHASGVGFFIIPGTNEKNLKIAVKIAENRDNVKFLVGIHPEDADDYENKIQSLCSVTGHPKCIGIGEVGLDYDHSDVPKIIQKNCFIKFIELACRCNFPIVIHTRNAAEDTIGILSDYAKQLTIILHCFTGDNDILKFGIENRAYFSIGGIATYPKAVNLQSLIGKIPEDRLIFETDSPYLPPIPFRGKRNEPAFIVETIRYVSRLTKISCNQLVKLSTKNALRAFKIHDW